MPTGLSKSLVRARSREVAVPRSRPWGLSRSVQARPTPPHSRQMVRKARSQYPAMGARRRLVASRTGPRRSMAGSLGFGPFGGRKTASADVYRADNRGEPDEHLSDRKSVV